MSHNTSNRTHGILDVLGQTTRKMMMNGLLRQNAKFLSVLLVILVTSLAMFSGSVSAQSAELTPTALCVRDLGEGANPRYEAHFGYFNATDSVIDIPAGAFGGPYNELVGGAATPFQPETFFPGQLDSWPTSTFYVPFNEGSVTWTVGSVNDLNPVTAFVTENSPACSYEIIIDKVWRLVDGSSTFIPPLDLTPDWRLDINAYAANGTPLGFGNCVYLLPDPTLRCSFMNPDSNVSDRL